MINPTPNIPNIPYWMAVLQTLNFLLTWGIAGFVWWDRRRNANSKRLTDMEARLGEVEKAMKSPPHDPRWEKMEKRLIAIEEAVKHPGVCSNHGRMEDNDRHINVRLDSIKAVVDKIDGRMDGINRMVDLLTQNELSGGK